MIPRRIEALCLLALTACGSAGPYGFAREYVPLDEEEAYLDEADEKSYEDVRRHHGDLRNTQLAWFGWVDDVTYLSPSRVRLQLTRRFHQSRHLCRGEGSDTCRVTVASRQGGAFLAELDVRAEHHESAEGRIWPNTLVRIYGTPAELSEDEVPVFDVAYYRHWPRGKFVTTESRDVMRR